MKRAWADAGSSNRGAGRGDTSTAAKASRVHTPAVGGAAAADGQPVFVNDAVNASVVSEAVDSMVPADMSRLNDER
ncbi:hypothetical protein HK105_201916 [Polyrhizophydium stewartii]|uniref:Uncharacterized protein n=1 Tax=Polyrhizophydium stewartii TaxID=2732419 RepID=A0ABR4NG57_9FUNG